MKLLINNRSRKKHVSLDALEEFEDTIVSEKSTKVVEHKINAYYLVFKIIEKLKLESLILPILQRIFRTDSEYFSILMGPHFAKCFPLMLHSKNNGLFIYDAWPHTHSHIDKMIKLFNIKYLYFSSKEVASIYGKRFLDIQVRWIPEGINPDRYKWYPYENKDIDIIQLGRKYDLYHNLIEYAIQEKGYKYIYQKNSKSIIFPTRETFVEGLARSRISICVPASVTHPEISGGISTVTMRYWQSMASKCLILGVLPDEMKDLFDYNPIIIIDISNPIKQLEEILSNYNKYIPLIEKNYERVVSDNTWQERVKLLHF
ncbi:hypothetical protein [Spirosoma pomorum]